MAKLVTVSKWLSHFAINRDRYRKSWSWSETG